MAGRGEASGGYLHMTGWQCVYIITHPVNSNENPQFTQFSHSSILLTFRQLSRHSTSSHAHSLLLNQIIITEFINWISDIRFAILQIFAILPSSLHSLILSVIFFSPMWILCKDGRFMKYERQSNNVSQRQDCKGRCWYYYIILGSWYSWYSQPVDQHGQPSRVLADNTKNVKRNKLSSWAASQRYLAWLGSQS